MCPNVSKEVKELLDPDEFSKLSSEKASELVLLHHVHLPYSTDVRIIGFEFECAWDYEHGFGIKFTDDLITSVGMADLAF